MSNNHFYKHFLAEDLEMLNRTINAMHLLSLSAIDKCLSASRQDLIDAELYAYQFIHHVEVVKALRDKKIKRDSNQVHSLAQNAIHNSGGTKYERNR